MQRLPRHIPPKIAMGMMLTGKPITAAEAQRLGHRQRGGAGRRPGRRRRALGRTTILECSPTLRARHQAGGAAEPGPAAGGVDEEVVLRCVGALFGSEDMMEGVMAFAQKRKPEWKGK